MIALGLSISANCFAGIRVKIAAHLCSQASQGAPPDGSQGPKFNDETCESFDLPWVVVPSNQNAMAVATATTAAATAYPPAAERTCRLPACLDPKLRSGRARIDRAGETVDLGADAATQQLESGDASQRDERCGNCVFGKFQTGFITQKSLNHFVAPFGVRLGVIAANELTRECDLAKSSYRLV